ncbi:MAG: HlyD family efflux transporter periplasmic adaptor subunit [Planctomycetota bacterium]|nr:HlyD family efflux transporter periplasmic adaptor subunit [Planctomycetota bacterium]
MNPHPATSSVPSAHAPARPAHEPLADLLAEHCAAASAAGAALIELPPAAPPSSAGAPPARILAFSSPSSPPHSAHAPHPPHPEWLHRAADILARAGLAPSIRVMPVEAGATARPELVGSIVVVPLPARQPDVGRHAALYFIKGPPPDTARVRTLGLLADALEAHVLLEQNLRLAAGEALLRSVLEVASSLSDHERFFAASLALVNALAPAWSCTRASLGIVKGRRVTLAAISHTDRLIRTTRLAQDLEAAMEECADQDIEVLFPAPPDEPVIARAAAELAANHASTSVLSVPLRTPRRVVGVLTLERAPGDPRTTFDDSDLRAARLLAEFIAPRIVSLHRHGRWFAPRLAADLRDAAALILGPRHTAAKLAALAALAAALTLAFAPATLHVDAPFRLEADQKRVIPAPFDGYLLDAAVEPGDVITQAGAPLARLDDAELRLELAAARARLDAADREAAIALRQRDQADAQVARARAQQARAQIQLLEHRIERAVLRAPEPGVVLAGELARKRGAPVRAGEPLLEIAPLDALRADMFIPESRIADLQQGQTGSLALAAYPQQSIAFTVEKLDPAAQIRAGRTVVRAQLRLHQLPEFARPGMEGVARVDAGERTLGTIIFRPVIDWLRMTLWL